METLLRDLRYALRTLRRTPGFTAVAVLTLALGIGANSAIFSVVNAVLLKPLEYREPERLAFVYSRFPTLGFDQFWISPPEYRDLQQRARSFSEIGAWRTTSVSLSGIDEPVRVTAAIATAELFTTLGVPARFGRAFTHEEDAPGVAPVVVISSRLWRSVFGGDPGIVGRRIEVNGEPSTVVGVMPNGFDIEEAGVDVWAPVGLPEHPTNHGSHYLNLVGRLAPDVTFEQARSEMDVLLGSWREVSASGHVPNDSTHPIVIEPLRDEVVGDVRPALLILLGAVGFVLLIACANVANLLLARAEGRQKEIAVRAAMGAGRRRLLRQFLTESVVLAAVGGAVGLLLGHWGLRALLATSPDSIPRADSLGLDLSVLLFTLGVALLTGVLFGLAPLLHLTQRAMGAALKDGGQRSTAAAGRQRLRRVLVVSEVALAVVLVVGSGLLLRSLAALQEVDPGFEPEGLLTFEISLPQARYGEPTARAAFLARLVDRLEAIPGIDGAAAMSGLPPVREVNANDTEFEGKQPTPGGPAHNVDYYQTVGGKYFETMGIPMVAGRPFNAGDDGAATPVAIINETLARVFYPDENPLGQRIRPCCGDEVPWLTIVGIARDVKQGGLSEETGTELYLHYPQVAAIGFAPQTMNLVIRTEVPPLSLAAEARRAVRTLDASLPVAHLQTMEANLAGSVDRPRFLALLLTIFAGVALALAAVGTYGVLSYSVAERNKEIGIRMALGAEAGSVRFMVLRDGLAVAGLGLALGLAGALALTRLLSALLFGINSADATTYVAASGVLAAVALAACWIPARRATRVDPMVALRYE
ncbi:MAG TPA: ABC transporter permease [Longimicrobiales bacterium]